MLTSRKIALTVTAGILVLISVWTVLLSLAAREGHAIAGASDQQARQASIYFKETVEGIFRYADSYTRAARREYIAHGGSLEAVRRFLDLFPLDREFFSHLTVMNADGTPILNTEASVAPGFNAADRDYFQQARAGTAGDVHISEALRGRLTGKTVVRVVRRITLPDGSFGGIIFVAVSGERIVELIKSLGLGPRSDGTLAGADKIVRARYSAGKFEFGQDISSSDLWNQLGKAPSGHYVQTSPIDGIRRHMYYHKVDGFPLTASIGVAESDVAGLQRAASQHYYVIAGAASLVIGAMVIFTLYQLSGREKLERATAALKDSEAQLRLITDTLPMEINYTDRNNVIRFANLAYARRHGFESSAEIFGRTRAEVWGADDHRDVLPGIEETLAGKITQVERRRVTEDGATRTVLFTRAPQRDAAGNVIGYVSIGQDITDRKTMEAALAQAQKMEAIGQLTGGIAHDFNNLLAVIMGNAELIRDIGMTDKTEITTILNAARRGAELTQRLLAFSRRQPLQPRTVDVAALVRHLEKLLDRTLGATIAVRTRIEDAVPSVTADPGQLENVLLNLAINARDAMPRGGTLTFGVRQVFLEASHGDNGEEIPAGAYVALEVIDTGTGMTADIVSRAIEPFFTTKDVGKGTGLGLSMAYGFARQSGGNLTIHSKPRIGTTVRIYLPVAGSQDRAEDTHEASKPVPFGKRERILLVEDDADVLRLVSSMLKTLDYVVITAADARAATARLEQGEKIDLLLSDIVLPGGISGPELAKTVTARWPRIKVLFISGYPAQSASEPQGAADLRDRLLSKPFTRTDLARRLRGILDA